MDLTLDQAAALLGKTARQVHYMIHQGKLPARKDGKRWVIADTDLPRSEGQTAAAARRERALEDAVDDALAATPHQRRRFSICDLRAFKVGQPIFAAACERLGADHPASRALHLTLQHLGRGCHRFAHADKAAAYRDARESASLAAVELALAATDPAERLLGDVEQELMPALIGLIRRSERRERA